METRMSTRSMLSAAYAWNCFHQLPLDRAHKADHPKQLSPKGGLDTGSMNGNVHTVMVTAAKHPQGQLASRIAASQLQQVGWTRPHP